jgi:hypothetical protein
MKSWSWRVSGYLCALLVVVALGCAKKDKGAEQAAKTDSTATTPANAPLTPATAPYASVITGKGYTVVQARRFPAQVDARRATVVVYRASDNARGGILYVRGFQDDAPKPVWHWYFSDGAPDSVMAIDINRDGLWDMRAFMVGGTTRDFVQDADFTFRGAEHDGLVAMNGASSAPDGLWKAFDADSSTAWKAPSSRAYIELPNPLGVKAGQLTVRLAGGSRPDKLEIGDGTQKLQEVDLAATAEEQTFQLDAKVKDLSTIRIDVVGTGKSVALSELTLQ